MEIELIESWIKVNAPKSIQEDLIEGANMLRRHRLKEKSRREQFPNEGNVFTDAENARIMELENVLTNFDVWSWERDREIEQEFGRPLKSIKGRLRRMNAKTE